MENKYSCAGFPDPQEKCCAERNSKKSMLIGILKEKKDSCENTVPLTPDHVELLTLLGHKVLLESGAGEEARFSDHAYAESGAQIVDSPSEIFTADVIVSVSEIPEEDLSFLKPGQIIFSELNVRNVSATYIQRLSEKKVTAFAYELFKDKSGMPFFMKSLGEIAGNMAALLSVSHLANKEGVIPGGFLGLPPTEVVIIGCGTVSEYATRAFIGLGAQVKVFGWQGHKITRFQNHSGFSVYASVEHRKTLQRAIESASILIGAAHSSSGHSPILVTEEMVQKMRPHSVIVDISINQGGCIETSQPTTTIQQSFEKHGVTHYCIPNIASLVPQTASEALSNHLYPVLKRCAGIDSLGKKLYDDHILRSGVYMLHGILTDASIAKHCQLAHQNIHVLLNAIQGF